MLESIAAVRANVAANDVAGSAGIVYHATRWSIAATIATIGERGFNRRVARRILEKFNDSRGMLPGSQSEVVTTLLGALEARVRSFGDIQDYIAHILGRNDSSLSYSEFVVRVVADIPLFRDSRMTETCCYCCLFCLAASFVQ